MDVRKKRLLYRSTHRGTKESDAILGGFIRKHLDDFSNSDLRVLEELMDAADQDMMAWLFGHTPVPNAYRAPVMDRLIAYAAGNDE